jgi:hypothetical protein
MYCCVASQCHHGHKLLDKKEKEFEWSRHELGEREDSHRGHTNFADVLHV